MLITLGRGFNGPARKKTDKSLKAVIASCVFDVDATITESYAGTGQTWANIVPNPADGSTKTAYDFYLGATSGASSDDPTFTGSAGNAAAYFMLDGGDVCSLKSGTNTNFLNNLHKTTGGTDFWMAIALYVADQTAVSVALSTKTTASTIGFNAQFSATEQVRFQQTGDSAATTITSATDHSAITIGTPTLIIASYSGGTLRSWVNGRTKVARTMAFNTTNTPASGYLTIGGQGAGGTSKLSNGTRIYAVSMGNGYIDDAQAALIFNAYNTRHGRTYA